MRLSLLGTYDSVGQSIWRSKTHQQQLAEKTDQKTSEFLPIIQDNINSNDVQVLNESNLKTNQEVVDSIFSDNLSDIKTFTFINEFKSDEPKLQFPKVGVALPLKKEDESSSKQQLVSSATTSPPSIGKDLSLFTLDQNDAAEIPTPIILSARRIQTKKVVSSPNLVSEEEWISKVSSLVERHPAARTVDPALGLSVIATESRFNTTATSSDGHYSKGLFQLLDATGKERLNELSTDRSYSPYDPDLNVALGMNHLKRLQSLFSVDTPISKSAKTTAAADGNSLERLMVAAFNCGEGRVARAQMLAIAQGKDASKYSSIAPLLPESTRSYVDKVFAYKENYNSTFVE
jgi:hypothetical protein